MYSIGFASILIAVVATAGAIPLCRSVFRWSVSRHDGDGARAAAVPVAGIAMIFGIFLSLFYLDASLTHTTALFVAIAFLIFAGFWMERLDGRRGRGVWFELVGSAVAGLALVQPLFFSGIEWSTSGVALLAAAMATPIAVSSLSRSPRATPALPTGIVFVQLLLLALLGAMGNEDAMTSLRYEEYMTIALPTLGAAIGALIYLCRMPWRAEAGVSTGVAAQLCLGLAVAWGAVRLGIGLEEPDQRTAALVWILAVPICECLRRYAVIGMRFVLPGAGFIGGRGSVSDLDLSPVAICMFVLGFGGIGIGLWRLHLPEAWSIALLAPALVVYSISPVLVQAWRRFLHSRMVDARS